MKRYLFVLPIFLVLIIFPLISAQEIVSSQVAYCEHMGYNVSIDSITNKPYCIFDGGTNCNTDEFYNGICGSEKIKEFPLRTNGQFVYLEFEKCEDGLAIREPNYLLSLPQCYKPTIFDKILNLFS